MRVGSAFAGIGGFDLAFERAGATVAWQIEIDPTCRRVLERHWPGVVRHDDIRTATDAALAPVDIITGGWPCQDLSVAGQRAGLSGARSGLFYDLCNLIAALRPTWIVLENVPGLLSSNGGRDMGAVLGALEELGYSVAYRVLDAQYYGVPQRRRRVFFVGHLGDDWRAPAAVLLDAASCAWHLAPRREARSEIARDIAASLRGSGGDGRGWHNDAESGLVAGSLLASGAGTSRPAGIASEADFLVPGVVGTLGGGSGRRGWCDDFDRSGAFVTHTLTATRSSAPEDGTGRGVPLVASTLPAGWRIMSDGNADNLIPSSMAVRRLTPRECERLQGFPDDWTAYGSDGKPISDSARYRMLGNSVAIPVVEWIAKRLMWVHARLEQRGHENRDHQYGRVQMAFGPCPIIWTRPNNAAPRREGRGEQNGIGW